MLAVSEAEGARSAGRSLISTPRTSRRGGKKAEAALAAAGYDALLMHAGAPFTYFADDQDAPFHPTPHFAHWVPVTSPGHLLARAAREEAARSSASTPEDYWYEQTPLGSPFWAREFELVEVGSEHEAWKRVARAGAHRVRRRRAAVARDAGLRRAPT